VRPSAAASGVEANDGPQAADTVLSALLDIIATVPRLGARTGRLDWPEVESVLADAAAASGLTPCVVSRASIRR